MTPGPGVISGRHLRPLPGRFRDTETALARCSNRARNSPIQAGGALRAAGPGKSEKEKSPLREGSAQIRLGTPPPPSPQRLATPASSRRTVLPCRTDRDSPVLASREVYLCRPYKSDKRYLLMVPLRSTANCSSLPDGTRWKLYPEATAQILWTTAGRGSETNRSSYAITRSRPRTSSSNSPGRKRKSGFDGRPYRSFPTANVS